MKLISNGELKPDKFHYHIFGIDAAKNLMITMQCYFGTKMDGAAQAMLAQSFVVMCACCLFTLFYYPIGPVQEDVMPLMYLSVVPSVYIYALTSGSGKAKK